jgi:YesN/AraC family two-component response regulator
LIFTAPHQVMGTSGEVDPNDNGWMLFFHPDLIRKSHLGQHIDEYTFFSYEANEALHLSDEEEETLEQVISKIQKEYTERIDDFSQRVMVSSLELLLNYCSRFYQRQFNTRTNQSSDVVNQVDGYIKKYFDDQLQLTEGLPSVQYFAEKVNLSANYLSDLLRKETGRALKDHINDFLIDKAKTILLNSNLSVSEIAYDLGFNYPHYFSRLFKAKTGVSPQGYRNLN